MLNAYLLKGHVDGWVDDMWFLAKAAIMQLYNLAGAPQVDGPVIFHHKKPNSSHGQVFEYLPKSLGKRRDEKLLDVVSDRNEQFWPKNNKTICEFKL